MEHGALVKLLLLSSLLCVCAFAQPSLSFGTPVKGELSASVDIKLSGSAGASVAALQFSLPLPASPGTMRILVGPAATAAQKTVACGGTTKLLCVIYGMNANLLADGVVANVNISATGSQQLTETLGDLLGASPVGDTVALTAPAPLPVSLTSKCDLNGDGKTDITDVAGALGQAQGIAPCATADISGRKKCDIVDIQLIVNAAVGGACVSGL